MKPNRETNMIFQFAFQGKLEEIKDLVINNEVEVNAIDPITKCAPIHLATFGCKPEVIEFLLSQKADVNKSIENYGSTPLHIASSEKGALLTASQFFSTKKDGIELITKQIISAQGGYINVATLLLEKGADTEAKDKNGMTPLLIAAQSGNVPMIKLLAEKGANIDALANNMTPLHFAIENGHTEAATTLLGLGADINKIDILGKTRLHIAIENNKTETALALIELGADVNLADGTLNFTPLQLAAQRGITELVEPLIEKGAKVNAKDEKGNTPLHLASKNGKSKTAKALLK